MPEIVLFIGSNLFREDYARVYDALWESLVAQGFCVSTVLGPQATALEKERFARFAPEFVDRFARSGPTRVRDMGLLARAMFRREIPVNRRLPLLLLRQYRLFVSCLSWLKSSNSTVVVSINFNACYPFVAAANALGIDTVAIQHGAYSLPPWATRPRARAHEWPASHILVWSDLWETDHRAAFPGQAVFASIDATLWHAKFQNCQPAESDQIVIYESSGWPEKTIQKILQEIGHRRVRFKPHPWQHARGVSRAAQQFPQLVDDSWLWERVPRVGVSLGSTVADELIYLGIPSVNLVPSAERLSHFPTVGTFPQDVNPGTVVDLLQTLLAEESARIEFVQAQRRERGGKIAANRPTHKVAKYCWAIAVGKGENEELQSHR